MNDPTIIETIFWAVCGVIALLVLLAMPIIRNRWETEEAERAMGRYDED